MLHLQYRSVEYYIEHMQRYSTATIPLFLRTGRTSDSIFAFVVNTVLNPVLTFIKNYILRGGFLDGREGLIFHLNHSAYVNWKFAKAWEAHRLATAAIAQPIAPADPAADSGAPSLSMDDRPSNDLAWLACKAAVSAGHDGHDYARGQRAGQALFAPGAA
jgi:hypothetical protein